MKPDYAVFIGRFQPFHNGHLAVVQQALKEAKKLIILVGSSNVAPTVKNPFTADERIEMIKATLKNDDIMFGKLRDYPYDDSRWVTQVQNEVYKLVSQATSSRANPSVALIGHNKDETSYYLNLFPDWRLIHADVCEKTNATDLRKLLYQQEYILSSVPTNIGDQVMEFKRTERFAKLCAEHAYYEKYKASFSGPYPRIDVAVDAVVTQNGHILLIKRKRLPGVGLWALPGGFLEIGEKVVDGAIRELREETRILCPPAHLRDAIVKGFVFDHPGRSLRGRVITHAFHLKLQEKTLPAVRGADDAAHAEWVPVAEVFRRENEFFDDHFSIIDHMLHAD